MVPSQPAIMAPVPDVARYVWLQLAPYADARAALRALSDVRVDESIAIGLGANFVRLCAREIEGLHEAPAWIGPGIAVPSTPCALWFYLRGNDPGELLLRERALLSRLASAFVADDRVSAFKYAGGRDLSGYEDGTENPQDEKAHHAAFVHNHGVGLDGGSFVAVQRWKHDLSRFEALNADAQDHTVGRRKHDNEELADAPPSSHVKRTAQESFSPEAFIVRRSMPWADQRGEGLVFVAFGATLRAFEAQMRRMVGHEDGIIDALFGFTRPVTNAYFWCPPVKGEQLDLTQLA